MIQTSKEIKNCMYRLNLNSTTDIHFLLYKMIIKPWVLEDMEINSVFHKETYLNHFIISS